MKAKEVYLHLAAVCERAAALQPEAKAGLLACAATCRRLAASFRPWAELESNPQQDKLAEQVRSSDGLDARSSAGNS